MHAVFDHSPWLVLMPFLSSVPEDGVARDGALQARDAVSLRGREKQADGYHPHSG
jgi:hypothetical protein